MISRGRPFEKGHKLNIGRKLSEEHKKKLSISHKGQITGHKYQKGEKAHLGYKHSIETRKLISEKLKGRSSWNKGKKLALEHRRKLSVARKGKKNPNAIGLWHNKGYVYIKSEDHPYKCKNGYIKRARLIMEKHLGRVLLPTERIHHINSIKDDDRIENLMLFLDESNHQRHEIILRRRDCKGRLLPIGGSNEAKF